MMLYDVVRMQLKLVIADKSNAANGTGNQRQDLFFILAILLS